MSGNPEMKRNCAVTVFFVDDQNMRVKRLDPFAQLSYQIEDALQNLGGSLLTRSRSEVRTALSNFITLLNSQASEFMTPGHLLLARTYFQLTQLFPDSNYFESEVQQTDFLKWANFCALKHLHIAQILEPHSSAEIQDAYANSSIHQDNHVTTADGQTHRFQSWQAAIDFVMTQAGDSLSADDKETALHDAEQFASFYTASDEELEDFDEIVNMGAAVNTYG